MSLERLEAVSELRSLVDDYAILTDEKKISEQMNLFTPDAKFTIYIGGQLTSTITGTESLEKEFMTHVNEIKCYFTINGQHKVTVNGDTAEGIVFSQMKVIREEQGVDILSDYSIRYDDVYVRQNGAWLIQERAEYMIMIESRPLQS
ncbi:nuclear transport factor 2 family protein [Paenibacillus sp. CFBP13512]|uniref:nuclear transport factor 2 family protein n=1 Tax=Paenibacillus sp. CFBP13512 TaxID=2184007 RepID=UPI0010C038ED|nr:nuclear transport factor 2 family protein [Paenibacillus sp. CFBP13512]TKJ92977.1 nuclear transport factor 2 family protein [Paenibacillus sp. CFBP13512]